MILKRCFIIFLFVIFFQSGLAEGFQKILVVRTMRIKPYNEAFMGFQDVCKYHIRELVISEADNLNIEEEIHYANPDLLMAIGLEALSRIKMIRHIPIIYLMIPNPPPDISEAKNITGVSMNVSPEKQLNIFRQVMPQVKKIALFFDPTKTGCFVEKAQQAARKMAIKLVAKEVSSPREVLSLKSKGDEIDAFWMIPDPTVICSETLEFLLIFSMESGIPVLTFSDKYVEMGALLSINISAFELGKQAGDMAKKLLSGTDIKNIPPSEAHKTTLSFNLRVAEKMGISLDKMASDFRISSDKTEVIRRINIVD